MAMTMELMNANEQGTTEVAREIKANYDSPAELTDHMDRIHSAFMSAPVLPSLSPLVNNPDISKLN